GSSHQAQAQIQKFSSPARVAKTILVRRSTHNIPPALSPLSFCPDTSRTNPRLLAMRKSPAHCPPTPPLPNWGPSCIARPLPSISRASSDPVPLAPAWQTRPPASPAFALVLRLRACPLALRRSDSRNPAPTLQISDDLPLTRFGREFRQAVPSSQLQPRATCPFSFFPELRGSPQFPAVRFVVASTHHPENESALPG